MNLNSGDGQSAVVGEIATLCQAGISAAMCSEKWPGSLHIDGLDASKIARVLVGAFKEEQHALDIVQVWRSIL